MSNQGHNPVPQAPGSYDGRHAGRRQPHRDHRLARRGAPQTSEGRFATGQQIGSYLLQSVLGEGSCGSVWYAKSGDQDIALKIVRTDAMGPGVSDMLMRDGDAARGLTHKSLARVLDVAQTPYADVYVAMEYVQGRALATRMDREGRMAPLQAVQLLVPIGRALSALHGVGVIHRDLRPENIIIERGPGDTQLPRLVDFGVAKVGATGGGRKLTQGGMILDSPDYQSPEQTRGARDVDQRTDVWALCVVLYECICGCRPFDGNTPTEIARAIAVQQPAPLSQFGVTDDALAHIIMTGLAKEPGERWPNMSTLVQALAGWASGQGVEHDIAGDLLMDQPRPSASGAAAPGQFKVAGHGEAVQKKDRFQPKLTAVAGKAMSMAEMFNTILEDPFPGWSAELSTPEGPSTAGGQRARQNITIISPAGARLAIGSVDAGRSEATLRTFGAMNEMHMARFKTPFPVSEAAYEKFLTMVEKYFQAILVKVTKEGGRGGPSVMAKASGGGGTNTILLGAIFIALLAVIAAIIVLLVRR